MYHKDLGSIFLLGDMNARTGNGLDYISNDDERYQANNDFYTVDRHIIERNNEDSLICDRGKDLLALCVSAQLRILNGRSIGDIDGKFTCSAVDYMICSEEIFRTIRYMEVLSFIGDLSDHCCLSCSIKCNYTFNFTNAVKQMADFRKVVYTT